MAHKQRDIVLSPLEYGNQKKAIRSSADIVCFTGNTGSGKSYALYYAPIQYLSENDNAKIVCFMRNVSDFWGAGKVSDTLKKMYPLIDHSIKKQPNDPIGEIIRNPTDMGLKLYNGSEIKFQQLDNESPIVIDKIAKGLQAKILIFDECNKFKWRTITSFFPRLRSDANGKAQIFLAQNPERDCFLRKLCGKGEHGGGWINDDGSIDEKMDGVVMFFNMQDGDTEKTYFGRTKKEVYEKCKEHIDALIQKNNGLSYEDFILSMVFFNFDVSDNKTMLAKNAKYRGLAANSATAKSSFENNWNFSLNDNEDDEMEDASNIQITKYDVERMFYNTTPEKNSTLLKRFMTIDMATTGLDNLVMKYWELWSDFGFVCKDIHYSMSNTNREAVIMITQFRDKHNLFDKEMIIDVQGFGFLRDCFPNAYCFAGASKTSNRSKNQFKTFKDEAAHIAVDMIVNGLIHYDASLAEKRYTHQKMKREGSTTILRHMKFESVIFQFQKTDTGRITMLDKTKQHSLLRGMSPDLFDNVIMLCGGTCYDCYRMLSENAGRVKKRIDNASFLGMLNLNEDNIKDERISAVERKKINNSSYILNILENL